MKSLIRVIVFLLFVVAIIVFLIAIDERAKGAIL